MPKVAAAAARRLLGGALQLPHEVVAIGQAGQRIVQGVVEQLALGLFAGRDVGLRAGDADRPAGLIAHRDAPAQHPAVAAVAVHHAVLALEMAGMPVEMLLQVGLQAGSVVLMHAVKPDFRRIDHGAVLDAQHRFPARRIIDAVGAQVPVPQAVVGGARGQRVARLALAQRFLGGLSFGDVADDRGVKNAVGRLQAADGQLGRKRRAVAAPAHTLPSGPLHQVARPGRDAGRVVSRRPPIGRHQVFDAHSLGLGRRTSEQFLGARVEGVDVARLIERDDAVQARSRLPPARGPRSRAPCGSSTRRSPERGNASKRAPARYRTTAR